MDATTLTRETVLEAVREIVAEKGPDYVYEPVGGTCLYTAEPTDPTNKKCGCLVGHLFVKLDLLPFETLRKYDLAALDPGQGAVGSDTLCAIVRVPEETTVLIAQMQDDNDSSTEWGNILNRAEFGVLEGEEYEGE